MTLLNDYISDLRSFQSVDYVTYLENKLLRRAVERTLHLAIEACLDIGQHIIAAEGFRRPVNNRDVFIVLAEEGILSTELLPRLEAMAGFRNLIVHGYAHIDDSITFGILKRRLGDFDAYARAILAYLST